MIFKELLDRNKNWINNQDSRIQIVSHYDTDGITSAAIIASLLVKMNRTFHLKIVDSLEQSTIDFLKKKEEPAMLLDLGNSHLDLVNQLSEQVLIIDHHQIDGSPNDNISMVHPLEESMAASAVCYLYAKAIDGQNKDLAYLAIIGSSGDREKIPDEIVEDASNVKKTRDLRFYGRHLKPIHKTLSDSFDPIIPGIFNNEGAAVEFLEAINVPPRNGEDWRKLAELSDEEKERLVTGVIIRRKGQENPDDILGDIYHLDDFNLDSAELSTIINAFSRTGYPSKAFSLCLKNRHEFERMHSVLEDYRKKISEDILYSKDNRKETDNFLYIFGRNPKIIGTISSLLLDDSKKGVMGFAPNRDRMKVSVRMHKESGVGRVISEIALKLGGNGGGHEKVGGALIPIDKVDDFISEWENFLNAELNW